MTPIEPISTSEISSFVPRDIDLPPGVAAHFAKRLEVLQELEGFLDRIDYAAEAVHGIHELLFNEVITIEQFTSMARRIRFVLQSDLGTVTSEDATGPRPR